MSLPCVVDVDLLVDIVVLVVSKVEVPRTLNNDVVTVVVVFLHLKKT